MSNMKFIELMSSYTKEVDNMAVKGCTNYSSKNKSKEIRFPSTISNFDVKKYPKIKDLLKITYVYIVFLMLILGYISMWCNSSIKSSDMWPVITFVTILLCSIIIGWVYSSDSNFSTKNPFLFLYYLCYKEYHDIKKMEKEIVKYNSLRNLVYSLSDNKTTYSENDKHFELCESIISIRERIIKQFNTSVILFESDADISDIKKLLSKHSEDPTCLDELTKTLDENNELNHIIKQLKEEGL